MTQLELALQRAKIRKIVARLKMTGGVVDVDCPNCDDVEMVRSRFDPDHYLCPTCDYAEQR